MGEHVVTDVFGLPQRTLPPSPQRAIEATTPIRHFKRIIIIHVVKSFIILCDLLCLKMIRKGKTSAREYNHTHIYSEVSLRFLDRDGDRVVTEEVH